MRNLVQYPITSDEVIAAADYAYDQSQSHLDGVIGTTVPYSLYLMCEFLREEETALVAFLAKRAENL